MSRVPPRLQLRAGIIEEGRRGVPRTTGRLRAFVRCCLPIIGIAIIAMLSEEVKILLAVLILPGVVILPLMIWSTVKMMGQAKTGRRIEAKLVAVFACSLIVLAVAVCFFFLLQVIGSHGSDRGVFEAKCLFALTVIVVWPLVDLLLFRYAQESGTRRAPRLGYTTILSEVALLAAAAYLLAWIIGPPVNAALRLQHREVAKALIDLGADVRRKDVHGATPLWWALHRADVEMAALLFEKGATLDGETAALGLHSAISYNNTELLTLLLHKGADLNATYMGATALLAACERENLAIIRILLENGADATVRYKSKYPGMPWDGKSALDVAREKNNPQMLELLLRYDKKQSSAPTP